MGLIKKLGYCMAIWFGFLAVAYQVLMHIYQPELKQELHLERAQGIAKIVVEAESGIQHIDSDSVEMMLFAQGYAHAKDRLWAMERLRRFSNGTLSEVLGDETLPIDKLSISVGVGKASRETWEKPGVMGDLQK